MHFRFFKENEVKWSESCSVVSDSLRPHGPYSPWNSPGQNSGEGCLSFSRGSSQPRDRTQASCIAGEFFTSWVTREAQRKWNKVTKKLPPAKILCSLYFNGRKKNFFWWHHVAYGTLVPWPRTEPRPPTKEAQRPSPWIPRKPLIRLLWRL